MKSSEFTVRDFELRLFLISSFIFLALIFPAGLKAENDAGSKDDEITKKEAELKKVNEDLQRTRVRIQNLSDRSRKGTITPNERVMLQQNMHKRKKLLKEKEQLELDLKALRGETGPSAPEKKLPEKPEGVPIGKPPGTYSY